MACFSLSLVEHFGSGTNSSNDSLSLFVGVIVNNILFDAGNKNWSIIIERKSRFDYSHEYCDIFDFILKWNQMKV